MNSIQHFSNPIFGDLRTVVIDGKEYFFGVDVATMLMYKRPRKAVTDNCKGVLTQDAIKNDSGYLEPLIPEGDIYRLIIKAGQQSNSKEIKDKADKLEQWIFDDIIPTIRKTGSYGQPQLPQTPMELLELHYGAIKQVDHKVDEVKAELEQFKQEIPIFGEECSEINAVVEQKVVECLGGKGSAAYQEKRLHRKLYRDIYSQTNREFGVTRYKAIKRSQYKDYIEVVKAYIPPVGIKTDIEQANSQQRLRI